MSRTPAPKNQLLVVKVEFWNLCVSRLVNVRRRFFFFFKNLKDDDPFFLSLTPVQVSKKWRDDTKKNETDGPSPRKRFGTIGLARPSGVRRTGSDGGAGVEIYVAVAAIGVSSDS